MQRTKRFRMTLLLLMMCVCAFAQELPKVIVLSHRWHDC
jgi:hypothetical protein